MANHATKCSILHLIPHDGKMYDRNLMGKHKKKAIPHDVKQLFLLLNFLLIK